MMRLKNRLLFLQGFVTLAATYRLKFQKVPQNSTALFPGLLNSKLPLKWVTFAWQDLVQLLPPSFAYLSFVDIPFG